MTFRTRRDTSSGDKTEMDALHNKDAIEAKERCSYWCLLEHAIEQGDVYCLFEHWRVWGCEEFGAMTGSAFCVQIGGKFMHVFEATVVQDCCERFFFFISDDNR